MSSTHESQSKYRNIDERRTETLNIIYQLRENKISSNYPAIKKLFEYLNEYVVKGTSQKFTIPFPEFKKKIKGTLPIHKMEKCVVVLKHID
tara:strand:- start:3583 stop:3855 length:273 start_codon:yes stop_codon:yes gene_type:complete